MEVEELKRELETETDKIETRRISDERLREIINKDFSNNHNRKPTEEEVLSDMQFIKNCLRKMGRWKFIVVIVEKNIYQKIY